MNAEQLLQHFERISEAPDAIKRLRRLILDLAVRGKLVEQDPNDEEPKDIKKQDALDAPFDLPSNWEWMRIGDQLNLLNGMAFKSTDWRTAGLRIVRIQNLNSLNSAFNFCEPDIARERSLIDNGTFLISWSGTPGTSFGAFIWERGPAVLNQHIFRCDFKTQSFIASFLLLAVNGRLDEMISKAHGGVGLQHITKGKLEALLIPVPPLAEQHRIVAKVDELMSLCDQLEEAKAEREKCRDSLVAASLQVLNQPDEEEETFREHARFTFTNLPRITTRTTHIKQLRQTILNLAVRGKLVEQVPSDEPASELLKRIGAEKARLVKAGEIRKPKPLPPINKEDLPVAEEISGWTWIRLGEVSTLVTKGSTPTSYGHAYTNEGVNFVKVESIKKGLLRPENITSFISDETNQFLSRSRLAHGDILFSIAGSIGTCAVVTEIILPANTNQACAIIRGTQSAFVSEFLLNSLQSSVASTVLEKARGGAMNNVSLEDIKNFVVPLPPLAEQQRIVAKVDELMAICDQLEAQITVTEQDSRRFLESVLADALAPGIELREVAEVA